MADLAPRRIDGPAGDGRQLHVLDLFGLNGWGDRFREAGHEVFSIDIDRRFSADAHLDIGGVAAVPDAMPWRPDVIFASPPCNSLSTGSMGKMWQHGSHPAPMRSERHPDGHPIAIEGMRVVLATLRIIAVLQPTCWVIENPRGRLRSLDLLAGIPRRTVWYCRLGLDRAKPRTSGVSSRPGSSCRLAVTTETPITSLHPGAVGRAHRVGSAPRRRGA